MRDIESRVGAVKKVMIDGQYLGEVNHLRCRYLSTSSCLQQILRDDIIGLARLILRTERYRK